MASSSDVEAVLESVKVEQTAHGEQSGLPATTTEAKCQPPMMQEQKHDDTAPDADHHDSAVAPPQAAAEVLPSEEPPEQQQKPPVAKEEVEPEAVAAEDDQDSTRERLKRHRREMAGRVWVPERWGQETLLKDWVDCAVFDRPLVPAGLLTARRALIAECCTRRPDRTSPTSSASSSPLRVHNGCS